MFNYRSFIVRGFPLRVNPRAQKRGFPTVYHILIFSCQLKMFVVFEQIPGEKNVRTALVDNRYQESLKEKVLW